MKYEQEKSERLLREAKKGAFEMSEVESGEFLDDMERYRKELERELRAEKEGLKKLTDKTKQEALKSRIAELEEQIAGFEDFKEVSRGAKEFTIKSVD